MPGSLKDQAAIIGIGETEFSTNSGRSETRLALEASLAAIRDAGLTPKDIDGVVRSAADSTDEVMLARALGIPDLRYFHSVGYGGGAPGAIVMHAAMAVALEVANHVLCYRALNERSGRRFGQARVQARIPGERGYMEPYGLVTPGHWCAMSARRHMYQYGTTSAQFGAVSVACRKHANRNPRAMMRDRPMTIEDHQRSRMIVDPLRLFDFCLESDGAAAVVVTSARRAGNGAPHPPAHILAAAQGTGSNMETMLSYNREDIAIAEETAACARALFQMAGVTPADIDVAEIYDHFTPAVIMALEGFGFCGTGEGGPFVEGGRLEWPDGDLPLNTHGGNLSEAYIHGFTHIVEGVRQIRRTSTSQVPDAELVLVSSGNLVPTSALILRR